MFSEIYIRAHAYRVEVYIGFGATGCRLLAKQTAVYKV